MGRRACSDEIRALSRELGQAELGDSRRSRRLESIVERAAARPDASFPEMAADESELEALYRFMSNEHVTPEAILAPHMAMTKARSERSAEVIVAHDTTNLSFEGEREGLGRLHAKDRGFWAHVALAMSPTREVFGVVGLRYGTRHGPTKWVGARRIKEAKEPSEALRWPQLVREVGERFGRGRVIHVMDREADWFELYQHFVGNGERFVVRMTHDRKVEPNLRVSDVLAGASVIAERDVRLSERAEGNGAKDRARHPARKSRIARLAISAAVADVVSSMTVGMLRLNFVHVVELDAPDGCAPVQWTLTTTEPIATADDVLRIVDAYRARWVIEELFKALKTGCSFERRQLGSYRALLNALAMSLPIASLLLRMRSVGRERPDAPATDVIDADLLAILCVLARRPVPSPPTARDVMYAIAGLGGHLPRNGDPGWMTLGRGMEHLLGAHRVLTLARTM